MNTKQIMQGEIDSLKLLNKTLLGIVDRSSCQAQQVYHYHEGSQNEFFQFSVIQFLFFTKNLGNYIYN